MRIFFLQFWKFSKILLFNLFKILDFNRNNLFTHFCFSELLILREKKGSRIFFGPLHGIPKKKFSKNIEKTPYRRVAQKRCDLHQALLITLFFDSPCIFLIWYYIYICVATKSPRLRYRGKDLGLQYIKYIKWETFVSSEV